MLHFSYIGRKYIQVVGDVYEVYFPTNNVVNVCPSRLTTPMFLPTMYGTCQHPYHKICPLNLHSNRFHQKSNQLFIYKLPFEHLIVTVFCKRNYSIIVHGTHHVKSSNFAITINLVGFIVCYQSIATFHNFCKRTVHMCEPGQFV